MVGVQVLELDEEAAQGFEQVLAHGVTAGPNTQHSSVQAVVGQVTRERTVWDLVQEGMPPLATAI
jgi:hypothetical protein